MSATLPLMRQLRAATSHAHARLEKAVDLRARLASRQSYRQFLRALWAIHAPLEASLDRFRWAEASLEFEPRRKLPRLERDLAALGAPRHVLRSIATCRKLPRLDGLAAAFGCLYVCEGATLGGQVIAPLLWQRLGITESDGAAFFAGYGARTAEMWAAFGTALEAYCQSPARQSAAVDAAIQTFACFAAWLATPGGTSRRYGQTQTPAILLQ